MIGKDELLEQIWHARTLSDGVLANTLAKLRKALGQPADGREPIETVRGRGYRFHGVAREASLRKRSTRPAEGPSDPFVGRHYAAAEHPKEEQFTLFVGLAHLWRVKEPRGLGDQLRVLESVLDSHDALERAYALCPTDHRIPGWLGPIKIILGNQVGDTELRDEGLAVLRKGGEHYPNFVLFSYVMIYADLPPDDPQFKDALAQFRNRFSLPLETNGCNQWKLDPACLNTPAALYNIEAGGLYAGDSSARAQDREAAIIWYTTAKESPAWANPSWDSWRYKDLLEERIRTVDERMKAAASPSTSDDLESVWNSPIACTICHAK